MKANIVISEKIFNPVFLSFLFDDTPFQIFYGGAGSGKSVFVAQRIVIDLLQGQRNYLVARKVSSGNRKSTFLEIVKVIRNWGLDSFFKINKTEPSITTIKGNVVFFVGLDDVEKVKSISVPEGVLTDIWIEEATEIAREDLKQLERRMRGRSHITKRVTLTFNPILKNHWLYKEFFLDVPEGQKIYKDHKKLIVHTTYKDNMFLSQQDIDRLEQEQDSYFYQVYTLGQWGVLGDVIFTNWEIADLLEKENALTERRYGLDFGFADSPAAFVEVAYVPEKKEIYILREVYEKELTNPELAKKIKPILGDNVVVCDSAEPKSIEELRRAGIMAVGAEKGKDSVLYGIQWLRQHKIYIDKRCQNAINEFQLYQWQKNKEGESLDRPIKKYDHLIDALRYALEQDMKGGFKMEYESVNPRVAVNVDYDDEFDIQTF